MSLTSYITYIFAADTSSTTGAGKTGLAFGDFTIKQEIPGSVLASLTPETIATLATFAAPTSAAHIRIKEVNSAAPTDGVYEVQIHDTNMAWANRELFLMFSATGARIKPMRIDLRTATVTQDDSGSVLLAVSQPSVNFAELHVTGPMTADSLSITNDFAIGGTFSTVGFTINSIAPGAPSGLAIVGSAMTLTSSYDPAKTASQAGDAMTLTAAYDAAKTAAQASDIPSASTIAAAVWAAGTRTLSSFGTLAADVWASASRTLTDIPAALLALFFTRDTTKVYADAVNGSVVKEIVANAGGGGGGGLTAQQVADALKLAPAAGTPAATSVYSELDLIQTQTDRIIGGRIIARSPAVDNGQHLIMVAGDDYNVASGQPLEWTDTGGNWPTLTSATITLTIRPKESDGTLGTAVLTKAGSVVVATGSGKEVRVEPLHADTVDLTAGSKAYRFDVQAVLQSGERVTLVLGDCTVVAMT